jgi:1-acyl-sn-glycerol-3-phosphate acyltransferase
MGGMNGSPKFSLPDPALLKALFAACTKKISEFKLRVDSDRDEFGMSLEFIEALRPFFQFLYHCYFRVGVRGAANIPKGGAAILVANHSGTVPYDGVMSHLAVFNEGPSDRPLRFLVDDFVFKLPLLGGAISRTGGVPASYENALRLLRKGELVMIFPEGVAGIGKTYDERYSLHNFGKGGFVRLAVETKAPVVPVAIVGAEEIHPLIWKSEQLGKTLGLPFLPFTPTFPWLGPLGIVPLPSKWRIVFGKPIVYAKAQKAKAKDDAFVAREVEKMRKMIESMLARELSKRTSIWI